MHERTQRALCRLVFGLLCALPTSATLTAIAARQTRWYTQRQIVAWEARLSDWCGVRIDIENWEPLAPGAHQFENVQLFDLETGEPLGKIRVIQAALTERRLAIRLDQPEIAVAQLSAVWRCLHDQLLCHPARLQVPIGVMAHDVTLEGELASTTLAEVKAVVERRQTDAVAQVQIVMAQKDPAQPLVWQVRRQSGSARPTTRWQLMAHSPLPCEVLGDYLSPLRGLGDEATFQGQVSYTSAASYWELELSGSRWEQVELARLFDRQAHRITGRGSIVVDRLTIRSGRLADGEARIWAGPGLVSRSLLERIARHWPSEFTVPLESMDTVVPYDRLGLWMQVQGAELRVGGLCDSQPEQGLLPAHTGLARGGMPIVRVLPQQPIAALSFASLLAPAHAIDVPRSSATESIVDLLMAPGPDFNQQTPSKPAVWMAQGTPPGSP
jgi:hypothetical protein